MFVLLAAMMAAGCGKVQQAEGVPGKTLCYEYYQRCVNRVFDDVQAFGAIPAATANCSASGCHQASIGAGGVLFGPGGKFLVHPGLPSASSTQDMIDNFKSALLSVNITDPRQSYLIKKALVEVAHSGGRIFPDDTARGISEIQHWLSLPVDDASSLSCASLFVPSGSTNCLTGP